MKKPRILLYDIETSPNLAYVWGKWQQNVIAFEKERELLCYAYKWLGDNTITCVSREGQLTDEKLVESLAELLQEADITVAHNGDDFDRKIIKSRMIYWDMKPLKFNTSVDTKKAAKKFFSFNGNSLNDLVKFLRLGSKDKNANQDFNLWLGCMKDDPKAWEVMMEYNTKDVQLLEKVYKRMLPWIEDHPRATLVSDTGECPKCGSDSIVKNGLRPTAQQVVQRWVCHSCASHFVTRLKKD